MVLEGPPCGPFALQAMQRVAIETPSLHFIHKMDKAFCIAGNATGWPSKPRPKRLV